MNRYFALDVETANVDQASICQIGIVQVTDGLITNEYNWFINPEDWFDPFNVSIHGIDEGRVSNCKKYDELHDELSKLLDGEIVVHHTAFDKIAMALVSEKYNLQLPQITWVDSARVVRRVFEEFRRKGYGLANLARHFGFEFKHHDALEDSRVTVRILQECLAKSETHVEDWVSPQFKQASRPNTPQGPRDHFKGAEGDPDGKLFGENAVFTGKLLMTRREAADIAAQEGITVQQGVNSDTTMLIVGIQDPNRLSGYSKSGKHRAAEKKVAAGQEIQILSENDFMSMLELL